MNVRNNDANIFHVHTYRCGHAGQDPDELYVRKAIELGASAITFWNEDMEQMSKEIVKTAVQQHVILEQNLSSMKSYLY